MYLFIGTFLTLVYEDIIIFDSHFFVSSRLYFDYLYIIVYNIKDLEV